MKKILSLMLAALLLVSAIPTALATNDYTQGTQVIYTANGSESYTITVPALLTPGASGTVTLSGTWADNRIVTVTADSTVTLKNSIKETDTKILNVNFDGGISEKGNNATSQTFTKSISVDGITDALFGTWSGKFNYNVEASTISNGPVFSMVHKPSGNVTTPTQVFNVYGYDVVSHNVQTEISTTQKYNANEYYVGIDTLASLINNVIDQEFYTFHYDTFGAVSLDAKMLNMTAEEICEYTAITIWPESHVASFGVSKTQTDFAMVDKLINGETISVPCVAYTNYDINGNAIQSPFNSLWVYNETTKTFTMCTSDTIITENMKIYTDCEGILLNAATNS